MHRPKMIRILFVTGLVLLAGCARDGGADGGTGAVCVTGGVETGSFVEVPAGAFTKGADALYPEEEPALRLVMSGFRIQAHEVTNGQFARFVGATGYITEAEKNADPDKPGAGSAVFVFAAGRGGEWQLVPGATWKTPEGPGSSIETRMAHPVVHVSPDDARAYAAWAGGRLPEEHEWEYAAHLGLISPQDQTSSAYDVDGRPVANTWQGVFPVLNTGEDGFDGTAPVGCFGRDRLGLADMMGNVWELTATPFGDGSMTIKGGSYLCADNFCRRYRPAARQPQETGFSASHVGFRIVQDLPSESGE